MPHRARALPYLAPSLERSQQGWYAVLHQALRRCRFPRLHAAASLKPIPRSRSLSRVGVVSGDHVHIVVSAPPEMARSEIMRRIKGRTASRRRVCGLSVHYSQPTGFRLRCPGWTEAPRRVGVPRSRPGARVRPRSAGPTAWCKVCGSLPVRSFPGVSDQLSGR